MGAIRAQLDRMGVPDWRRPTPAPVVGECPPWLYQHEEESRYWSAEGFGGHKQDALRPPDGLAGIAFVGHRITGRVNVDARLAPTIRALWAHGIPTVSSCQGGPWWWGEPPRPELGGSWACPDERRGYLTIPATHAGAFLRLLIGAARPLIDGTFEALVLGWGDSQQRHDHPHNWAWRASARCDYPREPQPPTDSPDVQVTVMAEFPPQHVPEIERRVVGGVEDLAEGPQAADACRDGPLAHHQQQPHPQGGPDVHP
jgi:hypothetical protein